ncbi:hypothetical protein [Haloferula sp.]|uniref:hypothetical protein n=1 Tax=Haloferula sp. TaxID=2497595 RepID=UPI00329B28EB
MNTRFSLHRPLRRAALTLLLVAGLSPGLIAEEKSEAATEVPTREDAVLVSITATIEAIDHEKREVTLKGALGNKVSFTVDDAVKRLDEFKVGDAVTSDYYVSLAFELREPTEEEKEAPIELVDVAAKAGEGAAPAAGEVQQIKAVCTIEGLDRPTETVTLKGPLGRFVTVRTADPANLPKLRIGQSVIVTYTEALAISLEKADAGAE